jgi:hypothetical protein
MKKLLTLFFAFGFFYVQGGEIKNIKEELTSIKKNLKNYKVSKRKSGNAIALLDIKLYKDKNGVARELVVDAEWEDSFVERGKYFYSKDGEIIYSFRKSHNIEDMTGCSIKEKAYFKNGKIIKKYKFVNGKCKKDKETKETIKSLPYLPVKIENPKKFFKDKDPLKVLKR